MHSFVLPFICRVVMFCGLVAAQDFASAQNGNVSPAFQSVIQRLSISSAPDHFKQIADAIEASELLKSQLNRLIDAGKLRDIKLLQGKELPQPKGREFGGFSDASTIYLSTELVVALRKSRLYDVVFADEVLPNNTVFVLAHLAHHVSTYDELLAPGKFPTRESYVRARLEDEAHAFIQAWNATVDDATRRSGRPQLSNQQLMLLLMNIRYRGIFISAMRVGPVVNQVRESPNFLPSGMLETSRPNVNAFVKALQESKMADIE